MSFMAKLFHVIQGYRKLLVALITLVITILMFAVTLVLLLKAYMSGGEFVEVVKALGSVISTVVVAYMGTNMAKHLMDAGKEAIQQFIKEKKK